MQRKQVTMLERPRPQYRAHGSTPPTPGSRTPILAAVPTGGDETVATIRIYDPIDSWGGEWGISAKEFTAALDSVPNASEIRLHINSPGGEVWEALAILNSLRAHPAKVTATVDGLAASAASFIAAGSDEVIMGRNSQLMIHDAWGICLGNAADMTGMADLLDKISDNIAAVYADKAGGGVEVWRAAMTTESWYSADEAVAAGLADSVQALPEPSNSFDLSAFKHQGRADAPTPPIPAASQADGLNALRRRNLAARGRLLTA